MTTTPTTTACGCSRPARWLLVLLAVALLVVVVYYEPNERDYLFCGRRCRERRRRDDDDATTTTTTAETTRPVPPARATPRVVAFAANAADDAELEAVARRRGRRLAQFTDVGNVLDTGYGGFPNALYRGWNPLQTFPTSCFTIGLMNPLYLAQCFAFTTSF
jgi:hypothetical protein